MYHLTCYFLTKATDIKVLCLPDYFNNIHSDACCLWWIEAYSHRKDYMKSERGLGVRIVIWMNSYACTVVPDSTLSV